MNAATTGKTVSPRRASFRERVFAVLTANVAVAFALGGWYGAQQYVLKVNSTRVLEFEVLRLESKILTTRPNADPEAEDRREDKRQELSERIGTAAIIAYVWEYMMYVAAAILEAAALTSTTTRFGRAAHLVAAWAILISTLGTLVAMGLLVSPSFGGMDPLPVRSYLYIAMIQGGYGAILLAAFRSKPSRPA